MKTFQTILIFIFFTLSVYSQKLERIDTKDLISISEDFGLDSALHLSGGFPIYQIDSITALKLLDKMTVYKRYTSSEYFFNQMAHNWVNKKVKYKTKSLAIDQLNDIKSIKRNDNKRLLVLDDKLIISILRQRISIDSQLISCYNVCDSLSHQQRENHPSFYQKISKAFTGESFPVIEDYKASQENCYKIMRLLGALKSNYFDSRKLQYHKSKLKPYERDKDIYRFEDHYREYDSLVITLISDYNSINELDFTKEPELQKMAKGYEQDKCWRFILQNNKSGFLDLGCRFDPLAGYGTHYKMELIDKNKLLIIKIEEWRS